MKTKGTLEVRSDKIIVEGLLKILSIKRLLFKSSQEITWTRNNINFGLGNTLDLLFILRNTLDLLFGQISNKIQNPLYTFTCWTH